MSGGDIMNDGENKARKDTENTGLQLNFEVFQ